MDSEAEKQRFIIKSRRDAENLLKKAEAASTYLVNPGKYIQFLYKKSREAGKSPTIEPIIYYASRFPTWMANLGLAYNARVNEHDYLIQDVKKRALYEKILSLSSIMASDYQKLVDIYNYQNTFFDQDYLTFYRDAILRSVSSHSGIIDISDEEINRTVQFISREYIFGGGEEDERQAAIVNALRSMYTQRYSIPKIIYGTMKGMEA